MTSDPNAVERAYYRALKEPVTDPHLMSLTREDPSLYLPLLYYTVLETKAGIVVELGTGNGQSAAFLAAGGSAVMTMDPVPNAEFDAKVGPFRERVVYEKIRSDNPIILDDCRPESVDILFVDSFHELDYCLKEVELWTPKMKDSGVILFDDVDMMPGLLDCLPFKVKGHLTGLHPYGFGYAFVAPRE